MQSCRWLLACASEEPGAETVCYILSLPRRPHSKSCSINVTYICIYSNRGQTFLTVNYSIMWIPWRWGQFVPQNVNCLLVDCRALYPRSQTSSSQQISWTTVLQEIIVYFECRSGICMHLWCSWLCSWLLVSLSPGVSVVGGQLLLPSYFGLYSIISLLLRCLERGLQVSSASRLIKFIIYYHFWLKTNFIGMHLCL